MKRLVEMTAAQQSQLNIPNPETMKAITEAAWRSRDGRYAVLNTRYDVLDGDGKLFRSRRVLRVYVTDDRGILIPIYNMLLECAKGVEAFILTEIDRVLADQPDRVELSAWLENLWVRASRPNAEGDRNHITLQGYAQYKTKGKQ